MFFLKNFLFIYTRANTFDKRSQVFEQRNGKVRERLSYIARIREEIGKREMQRNWKLYTWRYIRPA